jgi:hypothetical protein
MVSGAVALLLQDEPNLNPDQVKYRLKATANKAWAGYNATTAGAGYLDIYARCEWHDDANGQHRPHCQPTAVDGCHASRVEQRAMGQ